MVQLKQPVHVLKESVFYNSTHTLMFIFYNKTHTLKKVHIILM